MVAFPIYVKTALILTMHFAIPANMKRVGNEKHTRYQFLGEEIKIEIALSSLQALEFLDSVPKDKNSGLRREKNKKTKRTPGLGNVIKP